MYGGSCVVCVCVCVCVVFQWESFHTRLDLQNVVLLTVTVETICLVKHGMHACALSLELVGIRVSDGSTPIKQLISRQYIVTLVIWLCVAILRWFVGFDIWKQLRTYWWRAFEVIS